MTYPPTLGRSSRRNSSRGIQYLLFVVTALVTASFVRRDDGFVTRNVGLGANANANAAMGVNVSNGMSIFMVVQSVELQDGNLLVVVDRASVVCSRCYSFFVMGEQGKRERSGATASSMERK